MITNRKNEQVLPFLSLRPCQLVKFESLEVWHTSLLVIVEPSKYGTSSSAINNFES